MSRSARGIPSVTYCRVLSPQGAFTGQGDIISDGNSITVLDAGQPSSRHEVAQVLPNGISDEEVCEHTFGNQAGAGMGASLNPITACVSDAVTAIIFIVGSKETRKWHFLKKTVLPFVANELFSNIAEKDQQLSSSLYKAQINLSAFEIQDEIITDLLRPINRGLSLAVTVEDGVTVQGLQSEPIMDEMDLRRLLIDACDNRASHTLPPGGSIDTTSAIFEFSLFQSEGGSMGANGAGEGGRECHSRLLVVEVPSTDPLLHGGAVDVRQLQGPNLHKSLLTFLDVLKKLNTPGRAALAPFRSAKLTHYLSELLGGNSIVVGLGLLAHGEPLVTRKTLEVIGALSNALHYPIGGRELTDVLQGLLGKYRSMLMQLQDELLNRTALNQGSVEHEMTLEKQLLQLQRDLAEGLKEKNLAIEDRERVYEMAELLKAKFATLMGEKLAQSGDLAQSREDNVVLARTLMDKNLELSNFKEKTEKDIFDLAGQLMAARNHIGELDANIEELHAEVEALNAQIEGKVKEMGTLRDEIASLNTLLDDRARLMQIEKEKAVELGAELLTLVNRKDLLQKELDALTTKHEAVVEDLKQRDATEAALKLEVSELQKELRHKEEQMFELTKHSVAVELEAKQAKLDADQLALQFREKLLTLQKPGTTQTEQSISGAKYEELQNTIRKGAKVIKDLERSLRRAQADLEETKKENTQMAGDLTDVREKYREKLASLLIHDGDAASSAYHHQHAKMHHRNNSRKHTKVGKEGLMAPLSSEASTVGKPNNNNDAENGPEGVMSEPPASGVLTAAAQLQHQLLDSYSDREALQSEALERALQQCAAIKIAYRELYDKYRTTTDVFEEQMPKTSAAKLKPLEEQLKFAEVDLSQSEAFLDEMEFKERTALREKFESEQQAGILKNERLSLILATYQRNLEITEQKLVASQQENIDLHIQIKQLIQNSSKLQHQIKDLSAAASASNLLASAPETKVEKSVAAPAVAPVAAPVAEEVAEQQKQYAAIFSALTEQIKELKDQMRSNNTVVVNTSLPPQQLLSDSGSKAVLSASVSGKGASAVEPTDPASSDAAEAVASELVRQQSSGKLGHLSRVPTPPVTTPPRKSSSAAAFGSGVRSTESPETTPNRLSKGALPSAPVISASAGGPPVVPAEDVSSLNNPHGFKSMAECLAHITALESNTHQALTNQLQKVQQRASELSIRNAALEEELSSYQAYMRDVVPQYKKQLQYMKQQLKMKSAGAVLAAQLPPSNPASGDDFKLPLIK